MDKALSQLLEKNLFICNFNDLDKINFKVDWIIFVYVKQQNVRFLISKIYNFKIKIMC